VSSVSSHCFLAFSFSYNQDATSPLGHPSPSGCYEFFGFFLAVQDGGSIHVFPPTLNTVSLTPSSSHFLNTTLHAFGSLVGVYHVNLCLFSYSVLGDFRTLRVSPAHPNGFFIHPLITGVWAVSTFSSCYRWHDCFFSYSPPACGGYGWYWVCGLGWGNGKFLPFSLIFFASLFLIHHPRFVTCLIAYSNPTLNGLPNWLL